MSGLGGYVNGNRSGDAFIKGVGSFFEDPNAVARAFLWGMVIHDGKGRLYNQLKFDHSARQAMTGILTATLMMQIKDNYTKQEMDILWFGGAILGAMSELKELYDPKHEFIKSKEDY